MLELSLPHRRPQNPFLLEAAAGNEGFWEIDLASGATWFNDWVYERLAWPQDGSGRALVDLKPYLASRAWNQLLAAMRDHLEGKTPLEHGFEVRLPNGTLEYWEIRGGAQRDVAGHPLHLAGGIRDATLDRPTSNVIRLVPNRS